MGSRAERTQKEWPDVSAQSASDGWSAVATAIWTHTRSSASALTPLRRRLSASRIIGPLPRVLPGRVRVRHACAVSVALELLDQFDQNAVSKSSASVG